MAPFVLISAPVYKREWILPDWFSAIESQDYPLEDIGFIFEAAPDDEETVQCLIDFAAKHPELRCFDIQINSQEPHKEHPEGQRTWTRDHYDVMARFRNNLLNRATCVGPDRFFSLDTDILLEDSTTISELVRLTENLDGVSPLMFMTPRDLNFPSVMTWAPDGRAYRDSRSYNIGQLFRADVIMAAVMMSPLLYKNVRYKWHLQGEDLGFADECRNKGISLWSASYIYCPHIMSRQGLAEYKATGDPRKELLKEQGYAGFLDHC